MKLRSGRVKPTRIRRSLRLIEKKKTLRLYLSPPPFLAKPPTVSRMPKVTTDDNILYGKINGKRCQVLVDSGSELTLMCYRTAKRLHLLDKVVSK